MSYRSSSYSSSSSYGRPNPMMRLAKPPTPPPVDQARLVVGTDLNTISSFQMIRDWIIEVVQEKDLQWKNSVIESRAIGAWHHWSAAWKNKSAGAVEYLWDTERNTIDHQLKD